MREGADSEVITTGCRQSLSGRAGREAVYLQVNTKRGVFMGNKAGKVDLDLNFILWVFTL